jgi:hypothetical protein
MKITVVLRNPLDKTDQVEYQIAVAETQLGKLWYTALNDLLKQNKYLEKNFCFLGFPKSQRDLDYICHELTWAKETINKFFAGEYTIDENYTPVDLCPDGINPDQTAMNQLHNHFEHLQGTVWGLSEWYKRANYETKFAIRQLNNLCHEAESLMLSQRKLIQAPEWVRPSQITTFLNAQRIEFPHALKQTFSEERYDRKFGCVYLHWTQIGKTMYEVFNDEKGVDIDQATCDAITHLRFYSGEFDIEWGRDICYGGEHTWHNKRMSNFRQWLNKNNFNTEDPEYNFGYHPVGQVDFQESFGTDNPEQVWEILSKHLDIYKIVTDEVECVYDYTWTDENYYNQQIEKLKPGYDYSSRRV